MLGIFLIICMAIYWFIELKIYSLFKDEHIEPVELDSEGRTYNICNRAVILLVISLIVILMGYVGCAWPYLLVEGVGKSDYIVLLITWGLCPVSGIAYACYVIIKSRQGYIRISRDEIEYKRYKSFSIKVDDIKKISYSYRIHFKEKGKKPVRVYLYGFYKKREICSLMEQLKEHCAKVSGRERSIAHRLSSWKPGMKLAKYFSAFYIILISLLLLYTSYCCIDYDFFRKDYTAIFNALGAEPNQPENAWPHYVEAAVSYVELEGDYLEIIREGSLNYNRGQLNLTDEQEDNLRKWFDENTSSWASLKKATSINYCNATYENISIMDGTVRDDFSNPSDTGYGQIGRLYSNANAGRLAGVLDLDWFELFRMQLMSSKHFVNGKSIMDQLAGYDCLRRSINLLAGRDDYELEELHEVRKTLKEHFSTGLPSLSIECEILISCSTYDHIIKMMKIPVQTPLNPMFLTLGTSTGTEAYIRKHSAYALEEARKGIEVERKFFSITNPLIIRNTIFDFIAPFGNVYKVYQRADAHLLAGYFLLDLEEYHLMKGHYPVNVSQLREAGLTSELPDDPDSDGKIIYRNDGQRAILYAVGGNAKDDEGVDKKRDDIIYWQKNLKEEVRQ